MMKPALNPVPAGLLLLTLAGGVACKQDQGFAPITVENTVIVTGDFDRLEDAILRAEVKSQLFEGYIVQPVYELSDTSGQSVQQVEKLFTELNEDQLPILFDYDALFLNSGARGLGAYVYNDVDADDALVSDAAVVQQVRDFVGRRKTLVATDWAYDMIEAAWPDKIDFVNEGDGTDAAQVGISETVVARVTDAEMVGVIGADQVELDFAFGYWTVMQDVGPDVTVHMRGDVLWRQEEGGGDALLEDVPLLVSFEADGGRVIFSSFSWRAQRPALADALLAGTVEGLNASVTEARRNESGSEGG